MNKKKIKVIIESLTETLEENIDSLIDSKANKLADKLFDTWSKDEFKVTKDKLDEETKQCQEYYDLFQKELEINKELKEAIEGLKNTIRILSKIKEESK